MEHVAKLILAINRIDGNEFIPMLGVFVIKGYRCRKRRKCFPSPKRYVNVSKWFTVNCDAVVRR